MDAFKKEVEEWATKILDEYYTKEQEEKWGREFIDNAIFNFKGNIDHRDIEGYDFTTVTYLTVQTILDRFGHILTKKEIKQLESYDKR